MSASGNVTIQAKVTPIRINKEGYAKDGRYFGGGMPVFKYEAWDDKNFSKEDFFRASDYQTAGQD